MKVTFPKITSMSIVTIAVAFVAGAAVVSHQPAQQPIQFYKSTAEVSIPTADSSALAPDTSAQPAAQSTPSSIQDIGSTPTDTQATIDTTQAPLDNPVPPADPVVAVSATIGDWSAPVTADDGSVTQDEYCAYIYSDGSTQQRLYRENTFSSTHVRTISDPFFDCTLATAPAPALVN